MDKEILKNAFVKGNFPEYRCPYCFKGALRVEGEFCSRETEASAALHDEEWWEPEHIDLLFSCALKCNSCADHVFVVGRGTVNEEYDISHEGGWVREYVEYYWPSFFNPPLQLISYPAKAPKDVIAPLSVACSLFFFSPSSCCNSIRTSAEVILSSLGIPDKYDNGKPIYFANRIKLLSQEQESVRNLFNALRYLGNYGSHPGDELKAEDAIHALDIMEFLLEEVYGDRKQELAKLVAAINDRQGPVSGIPKI